MSYNNNYGFYTAPSNTNTWWTSNEPNTSSLSDDRHIDFNKQPANQNLMQSFSQNMSISTTQRSLEPTQTRQEKVQGTVTQLFANFGYINDNVIFSKSEVIGKMVNIGDKVTVDVSSQPNNSSKYKGERVCKVEEPHFTHAKVTPVSTNFVKTKVLPVNTGGRIDSASNNRWDKANVSPKEVSSPKVDSSVKDRIDSSNKHNQSQVVTVDLTASSRSDNNDDCLHDSLQDDPCDTDNKSHEKNTVSIIQTIETSISRKRAVELKAAQRIKDRLAEKKQKTTVVDTVSKKSKVIKSHTSTDDSPKRKAISPIKYNKSPKTPSIEKHKSEPKTNSLLRNYESFAFRELDCAAVRQQFKTLTLPKDFFHVSLKYQHSFPLNQPMKLGNNCQFKIMDKRVKCIDNSIEEQLNSDIDPEDADTTFVAKVMLLSTDDLAKFYKDTLKLAEEFDGESKIPITKAIKFLVGSVGQDKEFGIGGAWSPSLDGADPETNPRVLINTAVRTCKAMTGIDLSHCASWTKFMELRYYRPLKKLFKNKDTPRLDKTPDTPILIDVDGPEEPVTYQEPRMETVVYYIPDVWNCMPSAEQWTHIRHKYKEQLACIMCPPPPPSIKPIGAAAKTTNDAEDTTVSKKCSTAENEDPRDEEDWNETVVNEDTATGTPAGNQPTHFSNLVISGMKIVDIKKELELRKLNNRGVMEQLKARLKAALDREEAEDRNKETPAISNNATVATKPPLSVLSEDQKNEMKKLYMLPDRPEIIVHRNHRVITGDMKLRTMSLHSLLSYYNVKLDESTYELAIFAKQFLDMLRRDAVFNIYKSIVVAADTDLVNSDESSKKPKSMVTTSKRTINRQLLFSCSLLDREKTNKISVDDLKILIEGLGICLSSDQLSSVLGRVKDKSNYLNYRQLTDKEVTESDIYDMMNADQSEDLDYIKELAMGNKALFVIDEEPMESLIDLAELERLKNDLDRSERYRQSVELKIADVKETTERHVSMAQTQANEIKQLLEQATEYKSKYRNEQTRSDRYKRDYEKLLDHLKGINKLTVGLSKCVSESVTKSVVGDSNEGGDKKRGEEKSKKSEEEEEVIVMDLTKSDDKKKTTSKRKRSVDSKEKSKERRTSPNKDASNKSSNSADTDSHVTEDFDLSKASDYDEIVLEETE